MKSKTGLLLQGWCLANGPTFKVLTTQHIGGAFHFTGKTGIASVATVVVNGKHVTGWRFWLRI